MKLLRLWIITIILIFLTSCNSNTDKAQNDEVVDKPLPSISIIADSQESLALFKQEEKNIEKKFGVSIEYHYSDRLNDNLEDFLFASNKTYDIYMIFPAKIPDYVERDMLLPLDTFIENTEEIEDILPVKIQRTRLWNGL